MDRGERRAQRDRNLARWRRHLKSWASRGDAAWFEATVRKYAAHGKLCSCLMCGNMRKSEGETLQERRAALKAND